MIETLNQAGTALMGPTAWLVVWSLIKIVVLVAPLMGCVAYLTLWERKGIGWTQIRPGPNRVGPFGLLTPIADAVKLVFKEIIRPTAANKGLFFLGPVMTIMPALAAWAVVPFGPEAVLADVNAGLLFLMAITSLEVYGVIIAGWASNSKYAFLGALRASAQMVSYEIAMGFALVVVLMVSGTMNMAEIVLKQGQGTMAGFACQVAQGVQSRVRRCQPAGVLPASGEVRCVTVTEACQRPDQRRIAGGHDVFGGVAVQHQLGVEAIRQQHAEMGQFEFRDILQPRAGDLILVRAVFELEVGTLCVSTTGHGQIQPEHGTTP